MILCNFIQIEDSYYQCSSCGMKIRVTDGIVEPPAFPCRQYLSRDNISEKQFSENIKDLAKSFVNKDFDNQRPICTNEQIIKRHNICLSCEYLQNNTCTKCGCAISRNKDFANKLVLTGEECPIGKWSKEI